MAQRHDDDAAVAACRLGIQPMSPSSSTAHAAIPRTPSPSGSTTPPARSTAPTRCTRWCWQNSCARKAAIFRMWSAGNRVWADCLLR